MSLGGVQLYAVVWIKNLSGIFLGKFTWGGKMEYLNFVGGQGLCTVYSRVMSNP